MLPVAKDTVGRTVDTPDATTVDDDTMLTVDRIVPTVVVVSVLAADNTAAAVSVWVVVVAVVRVLLDDSGTDGRTDLIAAVVRVLLDESGIDDRTVLTAVVVSVLWADNGADADTVTPVAVRPIMNGMACGIVEELLLTVRVTPADNVLADDKDTAPSTARTASAVNVDGDDSELVAVAPELWSKSRRLID